MTTLFAKKCLNLLIFVEKQRIQLGNIRYTYRLVESVRTTKGVRQHTVLNLGRQFEVPRPQWGPLAQRITALVSGQMDLMSDELDPQWETMAQQYAARIVSQRGEVAVSAVVSQAEAPDYQRVDLSAVELVRPRSVGVEHVALAAAEQLGLAAKLEALGFNRHQLPVALGLIVGRMVRPGSELATHGWLQCHSGLGELLGYDFATTALSRLYRVSDQLLRHQAELEAYLYQQERDLFAFEETITLYDLTNTFFEGNALGNPKAQRGHSKEKRSDCPLVTLALVLDGSGFPKRSEIFEGNVSEPKTLAHLLARLEAKPGTSGPTVVLDAGIATQANIDWLKAKIDAGACEAALIKEDQGVRIRVQRVVDESTGEVRLYCHSSRREKKDRAIGRRFSERLEADLQHLAAGLTSKGRVKNYDKVLIRIGRLRQRYSRAARYYAIEVDKDQDRGNATAIRWSRITAEADTFPGVYCLRTNQDQCDDETLWRTYSMLTDLEAVFRSLKSELGMRPVFHHKSQRVDGHLFISVLAYHLVHTIRYQLKAQGSHLSWDGLRTQLEGQDRLTVVLKRDDGKRYHIRKASRPEPRQQVIYDALGIAHLPGKTEKTLADPETAVSAQM